MLRRPHQTLLTMIQWPMSSNRRRQNLTESPTPSQTHWRTATAPAFVSLGGGGSDKDKSECDKFNSSDDNKEVTKPLFEDDQKQPPQPKPPVTPGRRSTASFASPSESAGSGCSQRSRNPARTNSRGLERPVEEQLARDVEGPGGGLQNVLSRRHRLHDLCARKEHLHGEPNSKQ